eukprot:1908320-Pyramimonas_sp.AAC.1
MPRRRLFLEEAQRRVAGRAAEQARPADKSPPPTIPKISGPLFGPTTPSPTGPPHVGSSVDVLRIRRCPLPAQPAV